MTGRGAAALCAGWLALCPAAAAERQVPLADGTLRYDDAVWRPRPFSPPALAAFECVAADCGHGAIVTVVFDPRPLPRPGAAAFTPGAVSAAGLAIRVQDLTPGGRIAQTAPLRPIEGGYFGTFEIQDEALGRSSLLTIVAPALGGGLNWRLTVPQAHPALERRLLQLFGGWNR